MSRKVRKPMGFFHGDGTVGSWQFASRYAGPDGKIATLPQLLAARLVDVDLSVWNTYFTSASSEFVGRSRGGSVVIVVAHGVGPMSTLEGIKDAYSFQYKDKSRNNRGGRITQQQFFELLDGNFGEVTIVDFDQYIKRYQYPFMEALTADQCRTDPLVQARLGKFADAYISHHEYAARQWHERQLENGPYNPYELPWSPEARARWTKMHQDFASSVSPFIMRMEDPNNCAYRFSKLDAPLAHLLTVGSAANSHHDGYESLMVDVGCHEWTNGARFVGVPKGARLINLDPGVRNVSRLLHQHWQQLMAPSDSAHVAGFGPLTKVGDEWFTQYPKVGAGLDTHEAQFRVVNIEPMGAPVQFVTPVLGYYGFFKYDLREVQKLAPIGANAYSFVTHPELHNGTDEQMAMVQFYRVEVDTSQQLMHSEQLERDFDLQMQLIGA